MTRFPPVGGSAVGVITPYREQRALLRRTFEEVCGREAAAEVRAAGWHVCRQTGGRTSELMQSGAGPAEKVVVQGSRLHGLLAPLQAFIETVDSFQGRQLDVVILSCVRAGGGGGGLGEHARSVCGCGVLVC